MSGEGSHEIDTALTKQHHNYYGEEADPELARMLAANRNKPIGEPSPSNASNSDDESVDLTVTSTEVRNTGLGEIDTALTKHHHNYYGEEADLELVRLITESKENINGLSNDSNRSNKSYPSTLQATEVTHI